MIKFKTVLFAAIAIGGLVLALMIRIESGRKIRDRVALQQQQGEQLAALTVEHQRLSSLAASVRAVPPADHAGELAKLRAEVETLKRKTNDFVRSPETIHATRSSRMASNVETDPAALEIRKRHMMEARDAATAFREYAEDHQNQLPSSLNQIASYLAKRGRSLSGDDQFDILYQGSYDLLQGIPLGEVAVIRSQQVWQGTNGRITRVYGLADGHGQLVGSDDNFQSWEAQHVISAPQAGQSGQ